MEQQRLDALINLLDDPDATVFEMVEKELLKEDEQIIPALEKRWEQSFDENSQNRIENIILNLQFKKTYAGLKNWIGQTPGTHDLFEGFCAVDKFQYPDLNALTLNLKIEKLRKSIWLELNNSLTLLEKTTILNHFIFNLNGYSVNISNANSPQNCFLNQLIDTKRGNPISMSIFYTIIARSIELPAYLVDFPKNPLVAIVDAELAQKVHGSTHETEVLFYINPSNKGAITSRKEINYHLKRNNFTPFHEYAEPKPDVLFIERLLESMQESYQSVGYTEKMEKIEELLALFRI
ncbi:MAG TPA: transglutaminase family protein [Draconibacterium sp.]|nr:transglutaminase family protein [Draconibacterium sp.]